MMTLQKTKQPRARIMDIIILHDLRVPFRGGWAPRHAALRGWLRIDDDEWDAKCKRANIPWRPPLFNGSLFLNGIPGRLGSCWRQMKFFRAYFPSLSSWVVYAHPPVPHCGGDYGTCSIFFPRVVSSWCRCWKTVHLNGFEISPLSSITTVCQCITSGAPNRPIGGTYRSLSRSERLPEQNYRIPARFDHLSFLHIFPSWEGSSSFQRP